MRRYAEEHLDWSVKMRRLKDFLEALVEENGDGSVLEPGVSPLAAEDLKAPADAALFGAVQGDATSGKSREQRL